MYGKNLVKCNVSIGIHPKALTQVVLNQTSSTKGIILGQLVFLIDAQAQLFHCKATKEDTGGVACAKHDFPKQLDKRYHTTKRDAFTFVTEVG